MFLLNVYIHYIYVDKLVLSFHKGTRGPTLRFRFVPASPFTVELSYGPRPSLKLWHLKFPVQVSVETCEDIRCALVVNWAAFVGCIPSSCEQIDSVT